MKAVLKYTLARIGLLLAALLLLWPTPLDLFLKLLLALVVSFALSWFLLRGWRDEMAVSLAEWSKRRQAEKQRLRAALAGEDDQSQRRGRAGPDSND